MSGSKKQKPAKQLPPKKFLDVVDAHNAKTEGRTPDRVRAGLMAQPITVGGLTIHPVSIGVTILLEDIDHPILQLSQAKTQEERLAIAETIGGRDLLRLIYIFAQPEDAWRTMAMSKENFEVAARDFGFSVPQQTVAEVMPVIRDMIVSAPQTIPTQIGQDSEGSSGDPLAQSQRPPLG